MNENEKRIRKSIQDQRDKDHMAMVLLRAAMRGRDDAAFTRLVRAFEDITDPAAMSECDPASVIIDALDGGAP